MRRFIPAVILFTAVACLTRPAPATSIIVDVKRQKLQLIRDGAPIVTYPVSTSQFGLGDDFHSYRTPLGKLQICDKLGDRLPSGAVIKGGRFTGEVLKPNAPGRDPMVSRVIRLQGLEDQNRHALRRGILIHGTPEERRIGKPVSWGCIRMRSADVIALYNQVRIGTPVIINSNEKIRRASGWFFRFSSPTAQHTTAFLTPAHS